jgi:benzoyl-CoA reductase/2-hydroxyglutaryl-CoA dehydratase subunit BcrC/BadD/HgdB
VIQVGKAERFKEALLDDVSEDETRPLEKRYKRPAVSRKEKAQEIDDSLAEATSRILESMQNSKNRAHGMAYFDAMISGFRLDELRKETRKVIGHVCVMAPQEIMIAAGAVPVRLCSGFFDTSEIAEDVLPRDICPLVKSTMGFRLIESSYFKEVDAVVIPATCDAKKKLGEILADYMPVFNLDIPLNKESARSKRFWLAEVKDFRKKIEKFTGNKVTKKPMEEAIRLLYERTRAFRRLYEIRKAVPTVITEKDALLVVNVSFFDDVKRWTQKTNELCDELEQAVKKGKPVEDAACPRILITGSPIIWPNYKILEIAEEAGLNIVIDQFCSGTEYLYQPVEMDEPTEEDMLSAIAERYILPSVCPVFLTADDRTDRILEMAEQYKVEGVLYHVLRLCQVFDMESEGVRIVLEEKGMPMLKVITDYSSEDVEQLRTRIEAFREMLSARNESGPARQELRVPVKGE